MNETLLAAAAWLLGLCVGSFLNVVIYRLPLGLSVRNPTWSFCPACRTTLAWHDNLPVVGWLLLRGRCRYCTAPISIQYPLVEALTGLLFVLAYHLVLGEPSRAGATFVRWPADAPLLLAWLVLIAALLAVSVMDIVSYYIDPIVTHVAVGAGIVLMAAWPRSMVVTPVAESPGGAAAAAAFVASAVWLWWTERRAAQSAALRSPPQAADAAPHAPPERPSIAPSGSHSARGAGSPAIVFAVILVTILGLLMVVLPAIVADPNRYATGRALVVAAFLAVFAVMVAASAEKRDADAEIHEEVDEEAPHARRAIVRELLWLGPPLAVAGIVLALLTAFPAALTVWQSCVSWSPGGGFVPLGGAAFAMHGAMVGAAAGWVVRIVFTLVFGREAFGLGDIYILAAAGACAGWDIALLGFLVSVGVALLAWMISLFRKRTAMIAFGPPLALGFVLALWLSVPATTLFADLWRQYGPGIREQPGLFVALLLGSGAIAVTVSRLIRRVVEPQADESSDSG